MILVTGGLGYIGSHTILRLKELGYKVISVDDLSNNSTESNVNHPISLCNYDALRRIFQNNKINEVIHLAASKSVEQSEKIPFTYHDNNTTSLINVLRCCQEFKVNNLVFSSSCAVYGNATHQVKECQPTNGFSTYAHTKIYGEQLCKDFHRQYPHTHISILRYFNPVGVSPQLKKRKEPTVIQGLLNGNFKIFGGDYNTIDGTCIRDYIHIEDLVEANLIALQKEGLNTYNVGSGKPTSILQLIKTFEEVTNTKVDYEVVDRRYGDIQGFYSHPFKSKYDLGFSPKYTLENMIQSEYNNQNPQK